MMHILKSVAVTLCLIGCLPPLAHADDGNYVGRSTVVRTGEVPQACAARTLLISVSGDSFSFGKPAVAVGIVKPDGTFSARFSSGTGQMVAQFDLSGRIDGPKATGTVSASNGCNLSFALTKQ